MSNAGFDIPEFEQKRTAETENVAISREEIVAALEHNCEFFIQFFLGEELQFPVPGFHQECWELLTREQILYIALALPRGHAKTTLTKLACVWHFLFTDIRFIVYVSNTHAIASEACKDIMNFMRSDNFKSVFGQVDFSIEQDNRGYYRFTIIIPDRRGGYRRKSCILKSLGAQQQVRGLNIDNERPELAAIDDLEDPDENVSTDAQQNKLKKWFMGTFFKALSRKRKKVIYLGNMLSTKSILYHLVHRSQMWHSIIYGCLLSNGKPLWPEMWSFDAIKQDFIEYQQMGMVARWFPEMMNIPIAEGSLLITGDEISYSAPLNEGDQEAAFITVDPAMSKKDHANSSAIVVHGLLKDQWQIVETVAGRFDPGQMFMIILQLCLKWNTRTVGIEQGGYKLALEFLFEIFMQEHQQHFNVYEIPHYNRGKTERLAVWCALLKKGMWSLQDGDIVITQQLMTYDPSKGNNVDDIIDACAMGVVMTEMYMPAIMDSFQFNKSLHAIKTGYEVCDN